MTRALVIGYGSIGQRHALWLKQLGCEVAVVSRRKIDFNPLYQTVEGALLGQGSDYVVIANNTSEHADTLKIIANSGFAGKVLVEKPLFKDAVDFKLPDSIDCYVAYNLRFHPLLWRIRDLLVNQKILQANIYVGKYLPTWRPGERIGYSGNKDLGGGVLRDLSHELDYIEWLLGSWVSVSAVCGHFSDLPITSDDCVSVVGETLHAPAVNLQMNYLDRIGKREIRIQCDAMTIYGDLLTGRLQFNETVEDFKIQRQDTYLAQHRAVLSGDKTKLCAFRSGLKLMKVIASIEKASQKKAWIEIA